MHGHDDVCERVIADRADDARLGRIDRVERDLIGADNRQHVVKEGETLFSLAGRYFAPLPRPAGLWWVIADFQPDPVQDPTLSLDVGRVVVVPSLRTVTELIFSETRRREASG